MPEAVSRLFLPDEPLNDMEAANKEYVDDNSGGGGGGDLVIHGNNINPYAQSDGPSSFPNGISVFAVTTAGGWPGTGTVTVNYIADQAIGSQTFIGIVSSAPSARFRTTSGRGWSAWVIA